jgi:hypothetical protein
MKLNVTNVLAIFCLFLTLPFFCFEKSKGMVGKNIIGSGFVNEHVFITPIVFGFARHNSAC